MPEYRRSPHHKDAALPIYRGSHYKDMTVSRQSYLYDGNYMPERTIFILRRICGVAYSLYTCRYPSYDRQIINVDG